ncbi:APC family permease [Sulfurisphaera tokodaii]|uniref:APC family transporter n=2 Tax=Sulfurisphaera tokodaii TaxID=111955 RepID=Q96ZK3_SULTO|nr:APC family permease [Sulfurisphaera tokodaii]BAB66922.1 putative APC family transporter [Sulfurisphaera tokodaii str. 7]HII73866.1 APC family permease [Sulfurisphaera tokodaii]
MSKSSEKEERLKEPKREIGLRDLVFLSLGGQSPFLSVLVYGLLAFENGGYFAPIAVILGTLLVLINGLVVYRLSTKFTQEGGYYLYAYYSLTKRLGFETGWTYLLYSSFYGVAYALGASFVLSEVLSINPFIILSLILGISSTLALIGKKPSFRYAIFASILEIFMLSFIAGSFLYTTKFTFYNPFVKIPPLDRLALAIIFGSSIPTGYGSITPLSGEVKDPKKTVPRAIITVILLGGLLAAFDIYSIIDHIIYFHIAITNIDLIHLIEYRFGLLTLAFVLFAAANDGVLATLTYIFSTSRTIFAMAYHDFLPSILAKLTEKNEPFYAVAVAVASYWIISFISTVISGFNLANAFALVGLISLFANLYVHLAADFSLFKISLKRARKRILQLALSISAVIVTLVIFSASVEGTVPLTLDIFLLWLIAGFLIAEIIDMSKEED